VTLVIKAHGREWPATHQEKTEAWTEAATASMVAETGIALLCEDLPDGSLRVLESFSSGKPLAPRKT
jgi:hypothetical protein